MAEKEHPEAIYDVIIIGGGPAGLTAGLYAARADLNVMLLEGSGTVSQITVTDIIENYPGLPDITGFELVDRFRKQAIHFGLEIRSEGVTELKKPKGNDSHQEWVVTTNRGEYRTFAVIIATGATWRHLGVAGEEALIGRGVSFCATCDGPFYRNREVIVVGGGDTAVQEALFLTKFASKVTLIHRRDRLRATGILQKRAFANEKIEFAWNAVVEEIMGTDGVTGVKIRSANNPQELREIAAEGIFIFIGLEPVTNIVRNICRCDHQGYIIVERDMKTSEAGLFACGDCISKMLRQVITACGDGAMAAFSAELHVDAIKGQTY